MPSELNLISCKSPFVVPFSAQCYQGVTAYDDFMNFITRGKESAVLHEFTVREYDRYARLFRVYFHDHAIIHAIIDVSAGIVKTIVYSVQTDKVDSLRAEYFVYQIRQHLDRF